MLLKTKGTFWKQHFLYSLETLGEQFFYGMCVTDFNNLMSGARNIEESQQESYSGPLCSILFVTLPYM